MHLSRHVGPDALQAFSTLLVRLRVPVARHRLQDVFLNEVSWMMNVCSQRTRGNSCGCHKERSCLMPLQERSRYAITLAALSVRMQVLQNRRRLKAQGEHWGQAQGPDCHDTAVDNTCFISPSPIVPTTVAYTHIASCPYAPQYAATWPCMQAQNVPLPSCGCLRSCLQAGIFFVARCCAVPRCHENGGQCAHPACTASGSR